jgi:hypothetical protein
LFWNGVQLRHSLLVTSSISGTARNHKQPCQESRESGKPAECCAGPGSSRASVMNEAIMSWCSCQSRASHSSGVLCRTASRRWRSISYYYSLLTVWPSGSHLWCTTHCWWKKQSVSLSHCSEPVVLFFFWALGMLNASTVMTGPWFAGHIPTPMTHHQWSVFRNSGSLLVHSSMSCATSRCWMMDSLCAFKCKCFRNSPHRNIWNIIVKFFLKHPALQVEVTWTVTIPGKAPCMFPYYDSSKHCTSSE